MLLQPSGVGEKVGVRSRSGDAIASARTRSSPSALPGGTPHVRCCANHQARQRTRGKMPAAARAVPFGSG